MTDRPSKRARHTESDGALALAKGAIVKVIDTGLVYSSYRQMAEQLQLTRWQNDQHVDEDDVEVEYTAIQLGDIGTVLAFAPHANNKDGIVAGIYVKKREKDYLIGSRGLKVLRACPAQLVPAPMSIMKQMWESKATNGDVRILASDGEAVLAHACVVNAASPVLAAALNSGMRESVSKEITLPDIGADVVHGVLQLLYLGTLPTALDRLVILSFAHKYSVVEAVLPIANELIVNMTDENACSIMRMLRDFDKMGCDFVQGVLDVWGDDNRMMKLLLTNV